MLPGDRMLNRGASLALFATTVVIAATPVPQHDALRTSLTFHASFDGGVNAVKASGDGTLYSAPAMKAREQATPGLPASGEVLHARGEGRIGDALRFTRRKSPFVFFKAARNVGYKPKDWSG